MKECIQISRREENAGLGQDSLKNSSDEWGDWWTNSFNSIAKQISSKNPTKSRKRPRSPSSTSDSPCDATTSSDSSSDSDSDSSSSDSSSGPRYTAIKKAGVQRGKLGRVARQEAEFAAKKARF